MPSYDQYPASAYPTQQTDKFAQLNQQAFASNNAVASYMPGGPTVVSCNPANGVFGTRVALKISSQYDLFSMGSNFSLLFGSHKCAIQDVNRESQDAHGFVYNFSVDAPQFIVTGCPDNNVPLSLLMEGPSGEEISRTMAGTFQYLEGSGDEITGTAKLPKHDTSAPAHQDHGSVSPKAGDAALASETGTNNYGYPSQQGQYGEASFTQGQNDMISTYRSSSFAEPNFHRRSAHGWAGFNGTLGSTGTGRSPALGNSGLGGRSNLTPLSMPSNHNGTPQLIRTSTISNPAGSSPYHHVSLYSSKAVLKINGKLETMADHWSQEEWNNRRRLVVFRRSQQGSTLNASFRPVAVNDRPPNSICISCIYWAEKGECYVTSVDTIHLLEQLVAAPNRFSVEEKNRIRRNLEGFHPLTVSKAKAESEEFFKLIMSFPNPKPRNIEKDVKVFPWKILESALKKIIGKYSASPSSTLPPNNMITTPVPTAPYNTLPTPPGHHGLPSQPSDPYSQHPMSSSHHDSSIPSPRSLSGSQPTWAPYPSTTPSYPPVSSRPLSPHLRQASPHTHHAHHTPPIRLNTNPLPAVTTYDTRTVSTGAYVTGLHTPVSHHPSTSTPPRWDATPATATYADAYPSLTAHPTQSTQPVYGTGATAGYPDNVPPRA